MRFVVKRNDSKFLWVEEDGPHWDWKTDMHDATLFEDYQWWLQECVKEKKIPRNDYEIIAVELVVLPPVFLSVESLKHINSIGNNKP